MDAQVIQKGFNQGYFLSKKAPKLAEKYHKILADRKDAYAVGFTAGVKEWEKEQQKNRYKAHMKNYNIGKVISKSKNPVKNKDKRERDK